MRQKGWTAFLAGVTLLALAAVGGTQDYLEYLTRYLAGQAVARVRTVDDTDVAIMVKHVGSNTFAKLAIEADGNLTFTQDNTDGTTASTELECPIVAPLGGIIDVSDTACNTFGEVVDIINASTSWRAVLVGALRTDSSNDTLNADPADQDPQTDLGKLGMWDTNVAFISSAIVSTLVDGTNFFGNRDTLLKNPWEGTRAIVRYFAATSTYGSGTSTMVVYAVQPDNQRGSEAVTTLYSTAGGATTAEKEAITLAMLGGILGRYNEKLLVRLENSAAMATTTLKMYGSEFASR